MAKKAKKKVARKKSAIKKVLGNATTNKWKTGGTNSTGPRG